MNQKSEIKTQTADMDFKRRVFLFGRRPFMVYLAFLNAFVPISTDLYLPALPRMMEVFHCSRALADLTLSAFMLSFALTMLFWGASSDRRGRKPILLAGLGLYAAASLLCAAAFDIYLLIAGRVLQAAGSGAVCSVSMAVVKDVFKGKDMEKTLVLIQVMTMLAPMFAPTLGALLLRFTSWRGLFVILFLCALLGLTPLFFLRETLREPASGRAILKRIATVLGNPGLRRLLFLFSISVMPFMAYLTSSAFIYIKFYGLSEESFSLFFAANAGVAMLGPLLYVRLFRNFGRRFFLCLVYLVMAVSGVFLFFFGDRGPFYFIVFYLPLTLFASSSRPLGTMLMMTQLDADNGTVAALIGSCGLLCGGVSMIICSLGFANPVLPVACMAGLVGFACLVIWLVLDSRKLYREL
ncbi:MAG: MFS transporter [Desulfovibrio sp.]|jgi:DHA1 family bicyclomycin/chloramphenicol resistance-like MFS transporter|nr:MFS transporter [Desulfovibrio sp.]